MKILAIDTATPVAGVALSENEKIVAEFYLDSGYTHSVHLIPMVDAVLEYSGGSMGEIDAVAVHTGPGSFTGLRIGMVTAKTFAQSRDIGLYGVGTLESLAYNVSGFREGLVCPLLDARKSEVYTALYRFGKKGREELSAPAAVRPDVLAERLASYGEELLFLGEGFAAYEEIWRGTLGDKCRIPEGRMMFTSAASLCRAAYERSRTDAGDDWRTLAPAYLRKSEAEVKKEEKSCKR